MNKRILVIVALVIAMAIVIVSCNKETANDEKATAPVEETVTVSTEATEIVVPQITETMETMFDPQVEDLGDSTIETMHTEADFEETQPKETQPKETQPEETQPEETQPEETQPEETQPEETQPEETQPTDKDPLALAFEEYLRKTPAEQQAFYETFSTPDAFFSWYNTAKAAYDASKSHIDVTGGSIDFGKLG